MEDLEIGYAIGGSIAASAYGEPRSTNDVDLVLALPAHRIDAFLARLPPPKFDASRAAAWEAVGTPGGMFDVIHVGTHFKIAVYPVTGAIEASQVARARPLTDASGRTMLVSPPEELIVKKLSFYAMGSSDKHLRDVASILLGSNVVIDRERLDALVAEHGLAAEWAAVLARIAAREAEGETRPGF